MEYVNFLSCLPVFLTEVDYSTTCLYKSSYTNLNNSYNVVVVEEMLFSDQHSKTRVIPTFLKFSKL